MIVTSSLDRPRRWVFVTVQLVVLAAILAVAAVTRWMTGGWFLITVGVFVYPPVLLAHATVHVVNLFKREPARTRILVLVWLSHAALLAGFLAQYDAGDTNGFFALEAIFGWDTGRLGGWSLNAMLPYNAVVFLPVLFSWIYLLSSRQTNS